MLGMKTSSELEAVNGNCPVAGIIVVLAHSNCSFAKRKGVVMIEKYMHPQMSKLGCTQGNPTVNSEYMRSQMTELGCTQENPTVNSEYMHSWMTKLGYTQENLNKKAEKNKK